MEWIIGIGIIAISYLVLPRVIGAAKRNRKGNMAGATMALGLAFSGVFEPQKRETIEIIEDQKELGETGLKDTGDTDEGRLPKPH